MFSKRKKVIQKIFSGDLKKKVLKILAGEKGLQKNFFQAISTWRKQKKSSQIFREVSGVFQQNFNSSKNSAVLEPRTGIFSKAWGFEAKVMGFKMCSRGLHLWFWLRLLRRAGIQCPLSTPLLLTFETYFLCPLGFIILRYRITLSYVVCKN